MREDEYMKGKKKVTREHTHEKQKRDRDRHTINTDYSFIIPDSLK